MTHQNDVDICFLSLLDCIDTSCHISMMTLSGFLTLLVLGDSYVDTSWYDVLSGAHSSRNGQITAITGENPPLQYCTISRYIRAKKK